MEIIDTEQGSQEWLALRLNNRCASEAPAMMGDSKYMSRNELLALKKGWQSNPVDSFKEKLFASGHEHEEMAREILEEHTCEEWVACVGKISVDGIDLLASFDGVNSSFDVWEHKDWNLILSENARNGVLEMHYIWQLEQQALVAGKDSVLFWVSNGTEEKLVVYEYESNCILRAQLIAGWKQFDADLAEFELTAREEKIEAPEEEKFPAVFADVEGTEILSNLKELIPLLRDRATVEASRVLVTDLDFERKDQFNKDVKELRKKAKDIKLGVVDKFVALSDFISDWETTDSILQKLQSSGEGQVKDQKTKKKKLIVDGSVGVLFAYVQECNEGIKPINLYEITTTNGDFVEALKNKRTIKSWQNACDEEVAAVKVHINQALEVIIPNLAYIRREVPEADRGLFRDLPAIINQAEESFQAVVKLRIADQKVLVEQQAQKVIDDAAAAALLVDIPQTVEPKTVEVVGGNNAAAPMSEAIEDLKRAVVSGRASANKNHPELFSFNEVEARRRLLAGEKLKGIKLQ